MVRRPSLLHHDLVFFRMHRKFLSRIATKPRALQKRINLISPHRHGCAVQSFHGDQELVTNLLLSHTSGVRFQRPPALVTLLFEGMGKGRVLKLLPEQHVWVVQVFVNLISRKSLRPATALGGRRGEGSTRTWRSACCLLVDHPTRRSPGIAEKFVLRPVINLCMYYVRTMADECDALRLTASGISGQLGISDRSDLARCNPTWTGGKRPWLQMRCGIPRLEWEK